MEIFDKEGRQLYINDIMPFVARQIHFDLAHKFMEIARKYPNQMIREIPEFDKVQKIWDTMDFIEENYLKNKI